MDEELVVPPELLAISYLERCHCGEGFLSLVKMKTWKINSRARNSAVLCLEEASRLVLVLIASLMTHFL